jgi:hypothetical protein
MAMHACESSCMSRLDGLAGTAMIASLNIHAYEQLMTVANFCQCRCTGIRFERVVLPERDEMQVREPLCMHVCVVAVVRREQ